MKTIEHTQLSVVLEKRFKGNMSALARELGVTPQSVQQWMNGSGIGKKNRERLAEMADGMEAFTDVSSAGFVDIPRLDVSASAGTGEDRPEDDTVVELIRISQAWLSAHVSCPHNRLAIITAKGDSMEPTLRDGDLLLVDTSADTPNVDAIFVFTADRQLYVKRIQRTPGKLTAISDNTKYAPFDLDSTTAGLRFLGRVVFFWRGDKA